MGAIRTSIKYFYDVTSELVGIKSGLLLNQYQINQLLKENFTDDFLDIDDINTGLRIRAEDFEGKIKYIRIRIGNLPNKPRTFKSYQLLGQYVNSQERLIEISGLQSVLYSTLEKDLNLDLKEVKQFLYKDIIDKNTPEEIVDACIEITFERIDESIIVPSSISWDGITSLSNLFNMEVKPVRDDDFLDQKFLDYLAVNGKDIENIHWRNFERFCAQYFKKEGYEVVLGPGTNDGGVDIRVFDLEDKTKPSLLIQCKRYKDENKISIETVKAFYTDVLFEGAKNGLIATTGFISKGGKKVCDIRDYNITFAEKSSIENWAKNMWTFSPLK
ncbi:hypothetical protein GCM10028806_34840 [Spirosoma terrae]|uniref:Restriction endonuclease n=1 Tax=Spirosoma terrae TaxID=1968276 RepID=A0A6L9L8H0_9BACT|nr:restriction endonuclease [Spirosoma terrae]NDU95797.1 restriction endonuclease [Spirosoma terrae]